MYVISLHSTYLIEVQLRWTWGQMCVWATAIHSAATSIVSIHIYITSSLVVVAHTKWRRIIWTNIQSSVRERVAMKIVRKWERWMGGRISRKTHIFVDRETNGRLMTHRRYWRAREHVGTRLWWFSCNSDQNKMPFSATHYTVLRQMNISHLSFEVSMTVIVQILGFGVVTLCMQVDPNVSEECDASIFSTRVSWVTKQWAD